MISLAFPLFTIHALYAGDTWDGGGTDNNWGTGANWNPDGSPSPGSASDLYFGGNTRLSSVNNYGAFDDFRSITFNSSAGSFNITGNSLDIFGKIENLSTNLQTFAITSFSMNGSGTSSQLNPINGDLTVSTQAIFNNGNNVNVYGANGKTLTITNTGGAGLTGVGKLILQQNSSVVLTGSNNFTGNTEINAGTLDLRHNNAVSGTAQIYVGNGSVVGTAANLVIGTSGLTVDQNITVNNGDSGTRTIGGTFTSGTSTYSGTVELQGASTAGAVVLTAATGGTTEFNLVKSTAGTRTVTVSGTGAVSLNGTADNSNVGASVSSGTTLLLAKTSTSAVHALGVDSTVASGGTLKLGGSGNDQIFTGAKVTVNGTFDLAGRSEGFNGLAGTSGTITNSVPGTTSSLTVGEKNSSGTAYTGLIVNGSGTVALVKDGTGNQEFGGANTYSGGTFFGGDSNGSAAGTLILSSSSTGGPGSIASGPFGTGTLTLRGNGVSSTIRSNDTITRTVSNPIEVVGSSINTLLGTSATGDLLFDGTMSLGGGGRTFTVNNANTTFSGVVSNSGDIIKAGAGTMILSGNNTYAGATVVNGGVLSVRHSNALGGVTTGTSVAAGAALHLQGGIAIGAEALTLTGNTSAPYAGTDLTGALRNIAGTNSYAGVITLASLVAIGADAGSLSLTNTISNGGFRLVVLGAGDITASNAISGAGDLLKQDAGILTLTGNNTFGTGSNNAVFIDKGTIQVGTGGTLGGTNGTSTGWINMSASVAGRNGDTFLYARDAGVTIANAIDSRYYATDVPGTQTVGGLNTTGTTTFSGTIALHDNVTLTAATGGTTVFSGEIKTGSLSGANNQTIGQALVGGGGGVTKIGSGTVVFTANNTYTGATTISSGTLNVAAAGALGSTGNAVSGNGDLTVNNGGTLLLSGSPSVTDRINNAATVTLNGGTFGTSGLSEGSVAGGVATAGLGVLTLTGNSVIDLGSGASILAFANSSAATWTGTLSIYNWTGNLSGGGTDELFFGNDVTGLSSSQLGQISFYSDMGGVPLGSGALLSNGELVPVPEPSTWFAAAALLGLVGWRERKRVQRLFDGAQTA